MRTETKTTASLRQRSPARGRSDPLRWILLILLPPLVVVTVLVSTLVSSQRQMTQLESVLLNLMLFIFSSALAFLIARRAEGMTILATQEKLGESALRRIDDLTASCQRILAYVEERAAVVEDDEALTKVLVAEQFGTILRLLTEVRATLESAAEDWRRILPQEFLKRAAARGEAVEAYGAAVDEMSSAIEATRSALGQIATAGDQRAQEQGVQIGLLQDQLRAIEQKLSARIEQIKAEAGHPLPSPIPSVTQRAGKVDFATMPISKLILGMSGASRSEAAIVKLVIDAHGKPKPSEKTIREYIRELLKRGLLAPSEEGGDKLVVVHAARVRSSEPPDQQQGS